MIKSKNFIQKLFVLILSVFMLFTVFTACDKDDKPTGATSITLSATQIELEIGGKQKLQATVSEDTPVSFTSANETVATVTNKGVVTGVSAGETVVTATAGSAKATCTVTVKEKAPEPTEVKRTSFSGGVGASEIFVGDTLNVKPTLTVDGVVQTSNTTVSYTSSNANVATVADGVLTAVSAGETTIKATCAYDGKTYTDEVKLTVIAFTGEQFALVDGQGNVFDETVTFKNETPVSEQIFVRHYTQSGISTYTLAYIEAEKFDVQDGATKVGELTLSLTKSNVSLLNADGNITCVLENDVTQAIDLTVKSLKIGETTFDVSALAYKAYVKTATTYTDFVEFDETTNLNEWFAYDCTTAGGVIELDKTVTYNGAPSVKITVPTNASYFRFSDIISNSAAYGLKVGSKISFMIRYDGEPKVAGTNYYAIGKLTSKDGATQESNSNICGYADSQAYITAGKTDWMEVSYTLDDTSFPLVDLGFKISGNGTSTNRYVYIACIKIDNPATVDYTLNFANLVGWSSTGKNQGSAWWGYANGKNNNHVSQNAVSATLSETLKESYQTAFGVDAQKSVLLCPTKVENIDLSAKRCLQNISCEMNNQMKGTVMSGNRKIRARVYMEATGELPATSSVDALIFMRKDGDGYGFAQDKLQTLQANVWTELTFDVPSEYLDANYLTVAFNVKNYADSATTINFYIESLAFVSE
ncbi:MAG: Ig-like domain-containing protein [Clostridia bacterium]|nr:Ig-like domain-containing protein [Clostridia bacterium]